jgi:hypothetical protein
MRLLTYLVMAAALVAGTAPSSAVAQGDAAKVEVGKPAPSIELPATQIEKVLPDKKDAKKIGLKDFEGKKNVVLFFFPKAMTRG